MWKTGYRLNSAALRLLGAPRQFGSAARLLGAGARLVTGRMLGAARMLGAGLLGCAALLSGCVKDDAPFGEPKMATIQLSVGQRTVTETDGTPTDAESKLYTLRVYAFAGERLAGHYFTDNVTLESGKHTFYMDLKLYSAGKQMVDFYVVANEGAMNLHLPSSPTTVSTLEENTSKNDLKNIWFNNYLKDNLETKGLPMYYRTDKDDPQNPPVELDFTDLKEETAPAGSGHDGHRLLNKTVAFELERPTGKIGIFFAGAAEETGTLTVTVKRLTVLAQGIQARNYLMPQSEATLQGILDGGRDIDIAAVEGPTPLKELPAGASEEDRRNPEMYTPVMAEPFYPFENPWSNGGNWDIPGTTSDGRGHGFAIRIVYDIDGTEHSHTVYLPRIERNHYYAICCLLRNNGQIAFTYSVDDWATPAGDEYDGNGEYHIDFNYPTYDNPIRPEDGTTLGTNEKYPQPTVWYNSDPNSEAGSYTFRFNITGPEGLKWSPVRYSGASASYFEIKVYQLADDNATKEWKGSDECIASPKPYYIVVRALQSNNVDTPEKPGTRLNLGISYDRTWHPDGSDRLLINGLTHKLSWEGSPVAEYVVIKQIDVPEGQSLDDPSGENTDNPSGENINEP